MSIISKYIKKTGKFDFEEFEKAGFNGFNKEFIMWVVKKYPFDGLVEDIIKYLPMKFRNDEDIMFEAIKKDYDSFKYVGSKLKTNKDFLKKIVEEIPEIFSLLKEEKDFSRKLSYLGILDELKEIAIKKDGSILEYLDEKDKKNKKIVLEAVKNTGWALEYANDKLKDDEEVVKEAVKNDGIAIKFASERLKNNKKLALIAVKNNPKAFDYISEELKKDIDVLLALSNKELETEFFIEKIASYIANKRQTTRIHPDYDNDELEAIVRGIGLTLEEYEEILDKVNSRKISDEEAEKMTHREYELKKYGGIVRPDGKSFMIPGLQVGSENYVYQYAHFMGILVRNPERFLKILNWD